MNQNVLPAHASSKLHLRLYTGHHQFERKASLGQVHSLLESLTDSYELEVLDGEEFREMAAGDEALFTPMLIRLSPTPVVHIAMPAQQRYVNA
jgi:hypothetical protein